MRGNVELHKVIQSDDPVEVKVAKLDDLLKVYLGYTWIEDWIRDTRRGILAQAEKKQGLESQPPNDCV